MSEFLCLSPYGKTFKWHLSIYPQSKEQRVTEYPLVPGLGQGARNLSVDKTISLLSWSLCLKLKWMINKKKDQYMMSGKRSVMTKKVKQSKEKEWLKEGRAVWRILYNIPCGCWLTVWASVCLSQWECRWIEWAGRILLSPVFPVSVAMQGSGWTFHSLWKPQVVIIWSWREICMEQRRPERAGAILGERRPQDSLSQMFWK